MIIRIDNPMKIVHIEGGLVTLPLENINIVKSIRQYEPKSTLLDIIYYHIEAHTHSHWQNLFICEYYHVLSAR